MNDSSTKLVKFSRGFVTGVLNQPKMTFTHSRLKVPTYIPHTYTHTLSPKFSSVLLYNEPLSNYGPIRRKVHWMTPKWPWHLQGQNIHIHTSYNPRGPNLYFEPFLRNVPILRKVHRMTPNDLDKFKVRSIHMPIITIPTPKFIPVSLWRAVFEFGPILRKVHWTTPKWPRQIQGQKYTYAYHVHQWGPNCPLYDKPFLRYGQIVKEVHLVAQK